MLFRRSLQFSLPVNGIQRGWKFSGLSPLPPEHLLTRVPSGPARPDSLLSYRNIVMEIIFSVIDNEKLLVLQIGIVKRGRDKDGPDHPYLLKQINEMR